MDAKEFADRAEHLAGAYRAGALTAPEFLEAIDEVSREYYLGKLPNPEDKDLSWQEKILLC